jgi:hypothetical protein
MDFESAIAPDIETTDRLAADPVPKERIRVKLETLDTVISAEAKRTGDKRLVASCSLPYFSLGSRMLLQWPDRGGRSHRGILDWVSLEVSDDTGLPRLQLGLLLDDVDEMEDTLVGLPVVLTPPAAMQGEADIEPGYRPLFEEYSRRLDVRATGLGASAPDKEAAEPPAPRAGRRLRFLATATAGLAAGAAVLLLLALLPLSRESRGPSMLIPRFPSSAALFAIQGPPAALPPAPAEASLEKAAEIEHLVALLPDSSRERPLVKKHPVRPARGVRRAPAKASASRNSRQGELRSVLTKARAAMKSHKPLHAREMALKALRLDPKNRDAAAILLESRSLAQK